MDSSWVLDGEGRDDISHGLCKSQKRRWSLHPDKFSLQLAEAEHTSGVPAAISAAMASSQRARRAGDGAGVSANTVRHPQSRLLPFM
jgi:hypothetical protein